MAVCAAIFAHVNPKITPPPVVGLTWDAQSPQVKKTVSVGLADWATKSNGVISDLSYFGFAKLF